MKVSPTEGAAGPGKGEEFGRVFQWALVGGLVSGSAVGAVSGIFLGWVAGVVLFLLAAYIIFLLGMTILSCCWGVENGCCSKRGRYGLCNPQNRLLLVGTVTAGAIIAFCTFFFLIPTEPCIQTTLKGAKIERTGGDLVLTNKFEVSVDNTENYVELRNIGISVKFYIEEEYASTSTLKDIDVEMLKVSSSTLSTSTTYGGASKQFTTYTNACLLGGTFEVQLDVTVNFLLFAVEIPRITTEFSCITAGQEDEDTAQAKSKSKQC